MVRNLNVIYERKVPRVDLIPLGDIHYGADECNEKLFLDTVKWIRRNKLARVILMGDMINAGTRYSVGGGSYDDKFNPQEQYDRILEILTPIKDKIWGVHIGNHEERIYDTTSINLGKMMAKELGVPYLGFSAFHKVAVGEINLLELSLWVI